MSNLTNANSYKKNTRGCFNELEGGKHLNIHAKIYTCEINFINCRCSIIRNTFFESINYQWTILQIFQPILKLLLNIELRVFVSDIFLFYYFYSIYLNYQLYFFLCLGIKAGTSHMLYILGMQSTAELHLQPKWSFAKVSIYYVYFYCGNVYSECGLFLQSKWTSNFA